MDGHTINTTANAGLWMLLALWNGWKTNCASMLSPTDCVEPINRGDSRLAILVKILVLAINCVCYNCSLMSKLLLDRIVVRYILLMVLLLLLLLLLSKVSLERVCGNVVECCGVRRSISLISCSEAG